MSNPLRGRAGELASLQQHLGRLHGGAGTTWLIEGRPGLGKSRLVEQAASAARQAGFAVGYGAAEPGDAAVPLGVLMDALFEGSRPVLDRSALNQAHASPEQRYWLLQDIQALLEQAALRQPVLVCLDDLQWADSGTSAALRSLPARLSYLPVGWVLAFRPPGADGDLSRAVAELRRAGAGTSVLGRLDQAAVADVAADVLGAAPDEAVLAMAEGMHGNPFFLIELLSGLREEHLVSLHAGRATVRETRLPLRVRDSMRRRLGRMSPAARKIAAVAASMGRRFTVAQLAAVLDLPASALLDPLQELIDSELLAEGGETLSFTHDLNREAVRGSQPSSAVQALDRQAATALLAAGALPLEVATQLAASAAPGDEVAITTLMKAADALSGTDPGQAADLARRALELTTPRHPLRGPLAARAAIVLHAAGRTEEAIAFADGALRQALPAGQEAEVRLSIASLFSISPEVRADSCRRALALPGVPPDLRARLLAQLLYNLVVAVRLHHAEQLLGEVREAAAATRDGAAQFTLDMSEATLRYIHGHFGTALALVDAMLPGSTGTGDDSKGQLTHHLRCRILAETDRFDEALATVTEGIRSAQQGRQARAVQLFEANRARQMLQLGYLADAATALEGRFSPEEAHLVVSVLDADAVVVLGRVALHTADQRQTEFTAAVAQGMLKSGVPGVDRHAVWLLALQAQAAGDPAAAHRWLTALGENERLTIFPLFPVDPADDPQLVRIALGCGDRGRRAPAGYQPGGTRCPGQHRARPWPAHRGYQPAGRGGHGPASLAAARAGLGPGRSRRRPAPGGPQAGGDRRPRPGAHRLRRLRGKLGPGQGPPAPAAAWHSAPPACRAPARPGLGGHDGLRTRGGPAGGGRAHQPGGGRAPLHLPAHRQRAPPACLREARHQLAGRADPYGLRSRRTVVTYRLIVPGRPRWAAGSSAWRQFLSLPGAGVCRCRPLPARVCRCRLSPARVRRCRLPRARVCRCRPLPARVCRCRLAPARVCRCRPARDLWAAVRAPLRPPSRYSRPFLRICCGRASHFGP